MESANAAGGSKLNLFTGLFLVAGLLLIYYAYRYLYTSENVLMKVLISGKSSAPPATLPEIPMPLEGGEYTVTTWVYINSLNKNFNRRKHIIELRGNAFSTLLVGLGAFKNTLMVRVHTQDPTAFSAAPASAGGTAGPAALQGTNTNVSLRATQVEGMFQPLATDDSLLDNAPQCDLPEIDLQRWVMVTVTLNGRTTDVYLDGKLARSCVSPSYYRVDPTGVKPVVMGFGGFDGFVAGTGVANYAMNPGEIYRLYSTGPMGLGQDWISWALSIVEPAKKTT